MQKSYSAPAQPILLHHRPRVEKARASEEALRLTVETIRVVVMNIIISNRLAP